MNNRNTVNCGDILICMNCGKRFDEEDSHHLFFCSDDCELIFRVKAWRKANAEKLQRQMRED